MVNLMRTESPTCLLSTAPSDCQMSDKPQTDSKQTLIVSELWRASPRTADSLCRQAADYSGTTYLV